MRAVLDVNVLISALLSRRGAPAQLLTRWLVGEFELVVSEALLSELQRALAYPKLISHVTPSEAERFIGALRRTAEVVADAQDRALRWVDPGDDYLLALAARSSAILVSGDRHLLELSDRLPVRTAVQFLQDLNTAAE
ncbi:MAG TPA: putative toxin-antitoxin system toxin component, PIN family [Candidatus Dormibacteraeota bacterium]|nr:putative toxin-antitoxin system toxin component, PIN family [Candidatus Dormibacteraeota bacterium]